MIGIEASEDDNQTNQNTTYKTYKRRWYILFSFSLLAFLQCAVWNTFGPIVKSVEYAYHWSDATVAMMANWGTITFVIFVFPLCWILETLGLRVATITVGTLTAIGATLRVFSTNDTGFLAFAHICSIFNGISGTTIMAAPPALSAIWFPPEQRTTATCIAQVFNQLGSAMAFMLGPYLVPDRNLTTVSNLDEDDWNNSPSLPNIKKEIQLYMGIEAGIGIALLLAFIIYFPKQPPTPPSASASLERINFKDGLIALVKDPNVLLCTFAYALSGGVVGAWMAVMAINFKDFADDKTSGQIGLVMCLASSVVAIGISYVTDHLRKHIKLTLVILLVLEFLSFLWLTLICAKVIPFSLWQLYASSVSGSSFAFTLAPLFFEYTAELAYPVPEGVVGGFLTCFNNLIGMIFLSIFFIPGTQKEPFWMNIVLLVSAIVSIPAVFFTKESYRRLDIDVPSNGNTSHDNDLTVEVPYSVMEN